jgi:hypothetical protein
MGKLTTSSSFYSRGIPTKYHSFGYLVQGNYSIVHPQNQQFYGFLRNTHKYTMNNANVVRTLEH